MQCEILERFHEYIIAGLARREADGNQVGARSDIAKGFRDSARAK
jgi:hypothetical protein